MYSHIIYKHIVIPTNTFFLELEEKERNVKTTLREKRKRREYKVEIYESPGNQQFPFGYFKIHNNRLPSLREKKEFELKRSFSNQYYIICIHFIKSD
jgi:hypothetical protein